MRARASKEGMSDGISRDGDGGKPLSPVLGRLDAHLFFEHDQVCQDTLGPSGGGVGGDEGDVSLSSLVALLGGRGRVVGG